MNTNGSAIFEPAAITTTERAHWLAFRLAEVTSSRLIRALIERCGSAEAAWTAPASDVRAVLGHREKQLANLLRVRERLDPLRELERLEADGVQVIPLADEAYPALLQEIANPPPVLFVRGTLLEIDRVAVAVVGTRRVTPYGRDVARSIAGDLARAGVTVVSGLAHGVDGIAHQAALEANGRTIAVLGSGIHDIYPREHRNLAQRIAEQGAIMSDNLPNAKPDRWNFPARNRIISGLSQGVLVVEAPERSGALITVDFAADQGRDVFAVPGPVNAASSAGCLKIMRDGARPVRDANDILEDLRLLRPELPDAEQPVLFIDDDDRRVLHVLTSAPLHIDDVVEASGLPLPRVSAILLTLELQGLATNAGAQHYTRR